jgi:cellulose synthase/poly-beta-1,6-N-acetylglucosamine synthase-like glycosyltransferase
MAYQGEGIEEIKLYIAGFFMAFQYKTWKKIKFAENSLAFDSLFSMRVKELGLKIGLIRSLYVFHSYRLWTDVEPWNEKKHLLK